MDYLLKVKNLGNRTFEEVDSIIQKDIEWLETIDCGDDGNGGTWQAIGIKWYEHDEEMAKVSAQFPDLLFELYIAGEFAEDLFVSYFKNGQVQREDAVVTYPEFDASKLKPVDER